ncbi:hypothetical protein Poli38472_000171 [Pythium oligandrum]|uniref:Uncharacterized protein n=1 Tax=Pythium oligandrum TaxID=41045 RepID=A0A8K1CB65_PYTOL|nr:hypothetical protein Poli38472_000171 [Pythium oligandrum]|eukprot:TMW60129.1 hypothetical protein Poli38472_000171 [Pythium oligandrum]
MEKTHLKKELLLKPTSLIADWFPKDLPKKDAIHVLVDTRGKDHVNVAVAKVNSSLLPGGRKTRGEKCVGYVDEQQLRGGSQSCHTSTISSAWSYLLSFFAMEEVPVTKTNV